MGFVTPLLYSSVGSYYRVWNKPLVVSLLLTITVLSVEYFRLQVSIDAPVFLLQCSAVNDTFFTSYLSRLLTFPLARTHQHTGDLNVEVYPIMPRKESKAIPEGNGPVPQQEEVGSGQPMLADVYRMVKEVFDEMWDRKTHDINEDLRSLN